MNQVTSYTHTLSNYSDELLYCVTVDNAIKVSALVQYRDSGDCKATVTVINPDYSSSIASAIVSVKNIHLNSAAISDACDKLGYKFKYSFYNTGAQDVIHALEAIARFNYPNSALNTTLI